MPATPHATTNYLTPASDVMAGLEAVAPIIVRRKTSDVGTGELISSALYGGLAKTSSPNHQWLTPKSNELIKTRNLRILSLLEQHSQTHTAARTVLAELQKLDSFSFNLDHQTLAATLARSSQHNRLMSKAIRNPALRGILGIEGRIDHAELALGRGEEHLDDRFKETFGSWLLEGKSAAEGCEALTLSTVVGEAAPGTLSQASNALLVKLALTWVNDEGKRQTISDRWMLNSGNGGFRESIEANTKPRNNQGPTKDITQGSGTIALGQDNPVYQVRCERIASGSYQYRQRLETAKEHARKQLDKARKAIEAAKQACTAVSGTKDKTLIDKAAYQLYLKDKALKPKQDTYEKACDELARFEENPDDAYANNAERLFTTLYDNLTSGQQILFLDAADFLALNLEASDKRRFPRHATAKGGTGQNNHLDENPRLHDTEHMLLAILYEWKNWMTTTKKVQNLEVDLNLFSSYKVCPSCEMGIYSIPFDDDKRFIKSVQIFDTPLNAVGQYR